ncbi:MAG: hypothetical protein LKF71_01835 [Oscillospiraceae bacterium]|nr:hypothetical protein [Oscillospiraceae bacterium]
MDSCSLSLAIAALSSVIASHLNDHELVMASLVLTQIGDTLSTISAQRTCCSAREQQKALQAEPPAEFPAAAATETTAEK